ncbi:MAG TPA: MlaD family protein [Acidimicrobiales bacterium]|nr:MlaD family protein [Acidimicrobiales bacterium]
MRNPLAMPFRGRWTWVLPDRRRGGGGGGGGTGGGGFRNPLAKPFTERRAWVIGAVVITTIAVFVNGSLFLRPSMFTGGYTVDAVFSNSAGLQKGNPVLIAGVKAGKVGKVTLDGKRVKVALDMNGGVKMPQDSRADITVETLLGTKAVTLRAGKDWSHLLTSGDVITHTSTPVELLQLSKTQTHLLNNSNGVAFNKMLQDLAAVTKGKQQEVATIINGLNKLTTTVNHRSTQVSQLIDAANTLAGTLASHRHQLVQVINNLNVVLGGLAQRRAELTQLLDQTDKAAADTANLVGANKAKLNSVLAELHTDLQTVSRHQVDLAQFTAYLKEAVQGFASIAFSGAQPLSWTNIFTNPPSLNAVLGPCGDVADALNKVLGPDPMPCSQRYGPVPSNGPSSQGTGPAAPVFGAGASGPATVPDPSGATTSSALHHLATDPLGGH